MNVFLISKTYLGWFRVSRIIFYLGLNLGGLGRWIDARLLLVIVLGVRISFRYHLSNRIDWLLRYAYDRYISAEEGHTVWWELLLWLVVLPYTWLGWFVFLLLLSLDILSFSLVLDVIIGRDSFSRWTTWSFLYDRAGIVFIVLTLLFALCVLVALVDPHRALK